MTPYQDARQQVRQISSASERHAAVRAAAAELVAEMTRDERLECLDGDIDFWPGLADMIGGGYGEHTWPAAAVPRLGIPGIAFSDGPRGKVFGTATCFPVSMARAATWDVDLEERVGAAIGAELRADGANYFGGVCINLLRHPAWGRAQETYGEDPVVLGEFGAALTRGAQRHLMACVKHYALNSMENARFQVDVTVDDRTLHEVYLPHFRRVVDEGVASVMSAYNSVNGDWCGHSRHLLTDVLRDLWGFEGFVISDFISGLRDGAASVIGGMDIEMPFRMVRAQQLSTALDRGDITWDDVDRCVQRIVASLLRFEASVGEQAPPPDIICSPSHLDLAAEAARKSIVLLRNDGTLPIASTASIAVIGTLASTPNLGDRGSSRVRPPTVVTPLDGLVAAFGAERVRFDDGSDVDVAASIAADADVAIVVVGYTHVDEGEYIGATMAEVAALFPPQSADDHILLKRGFERAAADGGERAMGTGGDRRSLRLHADDEALIAAVTSANPRTVVCVMAGSAVVMPWAVDAAAVLMLWYPGMQGGQALAEVITGVTNPSGRLPFSVPHDDSHLPFFDADATAITYDRWHGYTKLQRDGVPAHFPFGYGLSYTTFTVHDAVLVGHPSDDIDGAIDIEVTVRNDGDAAGAHVVQVYGALPESAHVRAPRQLVGFVRTADIAPGASARVRVSCSRRPLQVWDVAQQRFVWEPGDYRFEVGHHVDDLPLQLTLRIG